jgi:hypothetical protein
MKALNRWAGTHVPGPITSRAAPITLGHPLTRWPRGRLTSGAMRMALGSRMLLEVLKVGRVRSDIRKAWALPPSVFFVNLRNWQLWLLAPRFRSMVRSSCLTCAQSCVGRR